jgi:hypothetical protein
MTKKTTMTKKATKDDVEGNEDEDEVELDLNWP